MSDRLYRKTPEGTWYAWYFTPEGDRVAFCTKQRDKAAAKRVLRDRERASAQAPAGVAANATGKRVADALEYLVEQSMTKQWAATTLDMFADKSGHLLRLLGEIALVELRSPALKQYIDRRLTEGAARETVRKELSTLRAALREAVELAWMPEELANGCIPRFAAKYKPRERWLSVEEYTRLLMALPAKRRTWLAMAVYLGGRFSELEGAAWSDVDLDQATLRLRGTKTDGADRFVPIPGPLLDVLRRVPKSDRIGTIAERWTNVRRDLAIACQLAGIQPVTPNDLRRTYASWLVDEGVPRKTISRLLGHKSTRMVDLVYGRLADETLTAAVARLPVNAGAVSDEEVGRCNPCVW